MTKSAVECKDEYLIIGDRLLLGNKTLGWLYHLKDLEVKNYVKILEKDNEEGNQRLLLSKKRLANLNESRMLTNMCYTYIASLMSEELENLYNSNEDKNKLFPDGESATYVKESRPDKD